MDLACEAYIITLLANI